MVSPHGDMRENNLVNPHMWGVRLTQKGARQEMAACKRANRGT